MTQAAALIQDVSATAQSPIRNAVLNGNMDFNQRYGLGGTTTGAQIAAGNGYSLDRWQHNQGATSVASVLQALDAPTQAQAGWNGQYSLKVTVTTPDASPAASDLYQVRQFIEGYNYQDLHAKKVRLQFWVKSSLTGTYSVQLRNAGGSRNYVATYTINAAGTWEQKTLDIQLDNTGTWAFDNTAGFGLCFTLLSGTTFQTSTLNTWQATDVRAANTQTNLFATNGNTWQITQVMLTPGDFSTTSFSLPFQRSGKTVQHELANCHRYAYSPYWLATSGSNGLLGTGICFATTIARVLVPFPVSMRVNPTINIPTPTTDFIALAANGASIAVTAFTSDHITTNNAMTEFDVASGLVAGNAAAVRANVANPTAYFDAEF